MTQDDCIFCRIAAGEIQAEIVYEDDQCLAFRDINPQAPVHILLIPRRHIERLDDLDEGQRALAGHLLERVSHIAAREGLAEDGFRTVINCGKQAGQDVFHIHLHILSGRKLTWPPG
jgi:histidine triad (HIT) family protein